ncbi:hypothetical protein [Sciscionella marina]|uniref:hypothetical protein n=1 Tax=Sciscionella marina TaxID=508770 RepID=UPI00036CE73B|nr:hypothetical protein [Sciscionella marina]
MEPVHAVGKFEMLLHHLGLNNNQIKARCGKPVLPNTKNAPLCRKCARITGETDPPRTNRK